MNGIHELTPTMLNSLYSNPVQDTLSRMQPQNANRWKLEHQKRIKAFVAKELAKLPVEVDPENLPPMTYKTFIGFIPLAVIIRFEGVEAPYLKYSAHTLGRFQAAQLLKGKR